MNAEQMKRNAQHCLAMANETQDEPQRMRFRRAASAWKAVARNKERLDDALLPDETLSHNTEKVA